MTDPDPADPLAAWRPVQTAWLEAWAKAMNEVVASDEFAQALGQSAEAALPVSEPLRRQMETALEHYLTQMHLPTQSEVVNLAERLTSLEMRVDDLDAKLDQALDHLAVIRSLLEARPAKRKKAGGSNG